MFSMETKCGLQIVLTLIDVLVVYARTDPRNPKKQRGISCFLIENVFLVRTVHNYIITRILEF